MVGTFALTIRIAAAAAFLGACTAPTHETSTYSSEAADRHVGGEGAPTEAQDRAELAFRLAAQAREDGDADAMLTAARLMLRSGTRPARLEAGVLTAEPGRDAVVAAWAREAILLADADRGVTERAEALMQARPRGILESGLGAGPLRLVQRLDLGEALTLSLVAEPGTDSSVAAIGDGDARLALAVRAGRQTICTGERRTTHAMCAWRARQTDHVVRLTNEGPLASEVMLLSN
ncbi:hypothetical protein B5C34_01975 [Pacificimonas flava]|uniref:Lipoprotein n=2 Tax=Pacificimonas TaxID=1960290 RepID=A0A219B1X4_9SPHN|nr:MULTISPECIES: hypothetical protein [Pacificimonas]MBZ6378014.1 hypothetical protein [Pacificimonas aurantium]OWV32341.1 hypothetical protein B5C34_01975 [Pacificimonas flava]